MLETSEDFAYSMLPAGEHDEDAAAQVVEESRVRLKSHMSLSLEQLEKSRLYRCRGENVYALSKGNCGLWPQSS